MLSLLVLLAAGPDLAGTASREVAAQECRAPAEGDAITVCGRRDQQKRYQVTDPNAPYDPRGPVRGVMTERMSWISEGDTGIGSCSGVGPSAGTGCFMKSVRRRLQQKGWLVH